jgi:hypothetical protein
MIPVKTNPKNKCFYSDTDSVFLQYPLDPSLIGEGLGQFKDELKGQIIQEAYFLADKFYGYKTAEETRVVVAGLPTIKVNNKKTSIITFPELIALWNGETLTYTRHHITKRLSELSLFNTSTTISVTLDPHAQKKIPIFDYKRRVIAYKAPTIFYSLKYLKLSYLLSKTIYSVYILRRNLQYLLNPNK